MGKFSNKFLSKMFLIFSYLFSSVSLGCSFFLILFIANVLFHLTFVLDLQLL